MEFRPDLIWLLRPVPSLLYLLLHMRLKAPPQSLTHTYTVAPLAQNALANLVLITPQKAFLQKPVGSQRGCGEGWRGLNLDDLID